MHVKKKEIVAGTDVDKFRFTRIKPNFVSQIWETTWPSLVLSPLSYTRSSSL